MLIRFLASFLHRIHSFVLAFLLGALVLACSGPALRKPIRFLAITDTHIAADSDLGRWRDFLHSVNDREAEFLIVLGDVVGHAPEYLEPVREIAEAAELPVYFLPGNHDDNYARNPEWWSSVFPDMYYAFQHRGTHFIMNWSQDSTASLQWLSAYLDSIPRGVQIVFCQHYPPGRSSASEGGPWPLLRARAGDIVIALSGHTHTRRTDTVGTILSETLDNCSLDTTLAGHFYEITLPGDGTARIEEFPLKELTLRSPEDTPPTVQLEDTSGYFVVENTLELRGFARDDQAVSAVEWRIDNRFWQGCDGKDNWRLILSRNELAPGHYLLWIRARDNLGQAGLGFERATVYVPEPEPRPGTVVLRQGLNGYTGCRDVTVRGHDPESRTDGENLECWIHGEQAVQEFSEIYIAFDLTGLRKPGAESRITGVKLVLYCCRQNSLSPEVGDDLYRVAAAGEPWSESMNYLERPKVPGWHPSEDVEPEAVIRGEWPVPDGRQEIRPAVPLVLDMSTFAQTVENWLKRPDQNHGWVISPVYEEYNISFRSSEFAFPTLRPRLEITFE